jgi:hypothetical protein
MPPRTGNPYRRTSYENSPQNRLEISATAELDSTWNER